MHDDLLALLNDVWERSNQGTVALPFGAIYAGYEAPSDEIDFVEGLHPDDVPSFGSPSAESLHPDDDPLDMGGLNTGQGYLWFASRYYVTGGATERVVIHANPYNRVIRLMKMIRREMLQVNASFAGVNSAKVATLPCFSAGRNDTIIIYTSIHAGTQAVVHCLRRWIAGGDLSPRDFQDALPYLIKREEPGIGWASEPPDDLQVLEIYPAKLSFGKYLSQVIQIGLQIFKDAHLQHKHLYLALMSDVLSNAGFNLTAPHIISGPTALFRESVPWPTGIKRRITPLYKAMVSSHSA